MAPCRDGYQTISHYLERRPWRERSSVKPKEHHPEIPTAYHQVKDLQIVDSRAEGDALPQPTRPRTFDRFAQIIITPKRCDGFGKAARQMRSKNGQTSVQQVASGHLQPAIPIVLHGTDNRGVCTQRNVPSLIR